MPTPEELRIIDELMAKATAVDAQQSGDAAFFGDPSLPPPTPVVPSIPQSPEVPQITVNKPPVVEPPLLDVPTAQGVQPEGDGAPDLALLEQLEKNVRGVMAEKGEQEPVEELEGAPPEVSTALSTVAGLNRNIALTLGVVPEAVNELLSFVGLGMWDPYQGKAPTWIGKRMQDMGIAVDLGEQTMRHFSSKVGSEIFNGMATLATLQAAAPAMAAKEGITRTAYIIREFGRVLQKNPALARVAELGAAPGVVYGEEKGGTLGAIAGGVAGATGATAVAGIGQSIGRGATAAGRQVARLWRPSPTPQGPLRDPNTDPNIAKAFVENQVDAEKMRMADAIDDAINRIPRVGTPEQIQEATRQRLERAEKIGARIESDFWDRVPRDVRINMTPVKNGARDLANELRDRPSQLPDDFLTRAQELSQPMRDPKTGRMMKAQPTVTRIRDFVGEIRLARKREEGLERQGVTPNYGKIRSYHQLETILHNAIEQSMPPEGRVALQQARRMSTIYNDLFTRGGVADVMARRSRGDQSIPAGMTVEEAMSKFSGIQDILNVRNKLVYKRAPGGRTFAVTPEERAELHGLVTDAENSIRAMFREAADTNGPEGAAKWFAKHEKSIRPMAQLHGELAFSANQLETTLRMQKEFAKSNLARFAEMDAEKAVNYIWANQNPGRQARDLMLVIGRNQEARNGLAAGVISKALLSAGGDPKRFGEVMNTPRYRDLLETVLTPEQYARLTKIKDISIGIQRGDEKLIRQWVSPGVMLFARFLGAGGGHQISKITGGGAIQAAHIGSSGLRGVAERMLKATPVEDLMVQAILDPKWEKVLLSRAPRTTKEARIFQKRMYRIIGASEAGRQEALNALAGEPETNDE